MNLVQEITNVLANAPDVVRQGAFSLQVNPHHLEFDPKTGAPLTDALRVWLEARGFNQALSPEEYEEYIDGDQLYVVMFSCVDTRKFERAVTAGNTEWKLLNNLRKAVEDART